MFWPTLTHYGWAVSIRTAGQFVALQVDSFHHNGWRYWVRIRTSTTEREERPRSSNPQPVLILPKVAPLRVDELLVTPSGFLDERPEHLVLVIEQENLEIREVRNTQLNEQTAHIEVFLIEPDVSQTLPASAAQMEHPQ